MGWWWSRVLLLQVIPLFRSASPLPFCCVPHLYTSILCSEVDCAVDGRVCDAEDVSDIVGRPQRVEMPEGGCAPDLSLQHTF